MFFTLILSLVMLALITILRRAVRRAFSTSPPQNTLHFRCQLTDELCRNVIWRGLLESALNINISDSNFGM